MNKFFQKISKWLPILIIFLGVWLRFFQLEKRTNFTADQGRDYLLVKQLIDQKKLTLLGPKASIGEFFFGPLYYYLLIPAVIIGNFDPLSGAVMSASLDVLGLVIFYLLSKKILSKSGQTLALSMYASSPLLVNMVKTALNPFVIPVFSNLFLLFLTLDRKKYPLITTAGVGIISGLLFQLHFATIVALVVGLIFVLLGPQKLISSFSYLSGFALGILPMFIFELRHQFFNSSQIISFLKAPPLVTGLNISQYIQSLFSIFSNLVGQNTILSLILVITLLASLMLKTKSDYHFWILVKSLLLGTVALMIISHNLNDHYAIIIFSTTFLLLAKLLQSLPTSVVSLIMLLFLTFNTFTLTKKTSAGYLMPEGWDLPGVKAAAALIAQDTPEDKFTVAATLDGDTRALPYRYLLEAKYNKIPLGVESYPQAEVLYVISRDSADKIIKNPVWEIASINPKQVTQTWEIQNQIYLHKISKNQ